MTVVRGNVSIAGTTPWDGSLKLSVAPDGTNVGFPGGGQVAVGEADVSIDDEGDFEVDLFANDDPGLVPAGTRWRFRFLPVVGYGRPFDFHVVVLVAHGDGPVDVEDILSPAPGDIPDPASAYATVVYVDEQVDDLEAADLLKAPLASPALTGTPTAPTAAPGTNNTQLATTAFVLAVRDALLNSAPGALDTLDELAAALGDDANFAAAVTTALGLKASTAGATFTGTTPTDAVNGLTSVIAITPPAADDDVVGLIIKAPDATWGVSQDYGEGNYAVMLTDADSGVQAPANVLKVISATTNATPVKVTTTTNHGLATGDVVRLAGTGIAAIDGAAASSGKWWKVTVVDADEFTLDGSTAPGSTASAGSVFTDRSAIGRRWSTLGYGETAAVHLAAGLRGVSGQDAAGYGLWIDSTGDITGLLINNASTAKWAPTPTRPFISVLDARDSNAVVFCVNAAGQTLVAGSGDGTTATPGLAFNGDENTGLGVYATDTLSFVTGGTARMNMNTARLQFADGYNLAFLTTTGTKFGTATNQKIGFFNATPVVQPSGVAVTAPGIHAALVSLGLIAA